MHEGCLLHSGVMKVLRITALMACMSTAVACYAAPVSGYVAKPATITPAMNRCLSCTKTRYVPVNYTVKGNFVRVDQQNLWVEKYGHGSPAVVLINGGGESTRQWNTVIPLIAKYTTVIAYDRPGLGRSPNSDLKPRTAKQVAEQLHDVLTAIHVKPPYVLVGHSIGGLYINYFARRYPKLTAGIVTLDGDNEYQIYWNRLDTSRMKKGSKATLDGMTHPQEITQVAMKKVKAALQKSKLTAVERARMIEDLEVAGKPASARQIMNLPAMQPMPLIALYEGSGPDFYYWREMMKQSAAQVPCSQAQYVANSSHHIMIDHPARVNTAVKQVVLAVRQRKLCLLH